MDWTVRFLPSARKEFEKIAKRDRKAAQKIDAFLTQRLPQLKNPRSLGEALQGDKLGAYWRYRVGDWRLVCSILDREVVVLVVRVGNRKDIYR